MMLGHAAAYHAIHRVQPAAQVGLAHAWRAIVPNRPGSRLDRIAAWLADRMTNRMFLRAITDGVFTFPLGLNRHIPEMKNTLDYFGVNYYFEHPVAFDMHQPGSLFLRSVPVDDLKGTEFESWFGMGRISTAAFVRVLREASAFHVPVYITENGMFDAGKDIQERYLVTHLNALRQAIRSGVDVRGYFWWSLMDNFEWDSGYWLRFGLAHVDFDTQVRTPRPSAALMARIIAENGVGDDLLTRYGESLT
jgi:beta-glucosidase